MGRENCGRKNRGLSEQYKHLSLFCTATQWDRLNYLADGVNKSVSRYILDTIFADENKVPAKLGEVKNEDRKSKSLCFKIDELDRIRSLAEKNGKSVSNYILGMTL